MNLEKLIKLHNFFLSIPFENISLFYKNSIIFEDEIPENLKKNLGATCFPLSLYAKKILEQNDFQPQLVFFDLNRPINENIIIEKPIDNKYHTALILPYKDGYFILDYGLSFEKPLFFSKKNPNQTYQLKTKKIIFSQIDFNKYVLFIETAQKKENPLIFDLSFTYSIQDILRHYENNFKRIVPLKYSILSNNKKYSLKITHDAFLIKISSSQIDYIKLNNLNEVAEFFDLDKQILEKAYLNWSKKYKQKYFKLQKN